MHQIFVNLSGYSSRDIARLLLKVLCFGQFSPLLYESNPSIQAKVVASSIRNGAY